MNPALDKVRQAVAELPKATRSPKGTLSQFLPLVLEARAVGKTTRQVFEVALQQGAIPAGTQFRTFSTAISQANRRARRRAEGDNR